MIPINIEGTWIEDNSPNPWILELTQADRYILGRASYTRRSPTHPNVQGRIGARTITLAIQCNNLFRMILQLKHNQLIGISSYPDTLDAPITFTKAPK